MSATPAPRRRQRTVQVIIGVVLVAVAFVGVLIFANLARGAVSKTTVIGAAKDIKTQHVITADDLTTVTVDTVPTGAIKDKNGAVGKIARQDIGNGQPVLDTHLAAPAVVTPARLFFALPAGKVALNIPPGDISPYVQPGDAIDIIATPKVASNLPAGVANPNQTKATLKGLRVLAVGTPQATPGPGANPPPTSAGNLVVEVSLQDAETLEFIVKNTDFTYVLKSPLDVNSPDPATSGTDLGSFKAAFGYK